MKVNISDLTEEEAKELLQSKNYKISLYKLEEYLRAAEKYGAIGMDDKSIEIASKIRLEFYEILRDNNVNLWD